MLFLLFLFLHMMITKHRPLKTQNPEVGSLLIKKNMPSFSKRHQRRHHHHHSHHCRRQHFHNRRRSRTAKATRISVTKSITKSINAVCRRIIKFLSKLGTHLGTRKCHRLDYGDLHFQYEFNPGIGLGMGYHIMPQAPMFDLCLLPPLGPEKKRTIILDLDDTLTHATLDSPPETYDFMVSPSIEGQTIDMYVLKRPGVDEFLEEISKNYEVVVFTAGLKEYASMVLDKLDPNGLICHRLYRDSCRMMQGRFVKDLSQIGRDLSEVVIVDDNPYSYALQPENAIPIKRFIDDSKDGELQKVAGFLRRCDGFRDMRDAVKHFFRGRPNNLAA